MKSDGVKALAWPGLAITLILFVAGLVLYEIGNRPGRLRIAQARTELASAGSPEALVKMGQRPSNMSKCGVGQLRRKGYAYAWQSGRARGVFCLPVDGRPTRIIIDDH